MKINEDMLPIVISATEPMGKQRKKIWIQCGNNLFDRSNWTNKGNVSLSSSSYAITSTAISSDTWDFNHCQYKALLKKGSYSITFYFSTQETHNSSGMRIYNSSGTALRNRAVKNSDMITESLYFGEDTKIGIMLKLSDGVCRIMINYNSTLPYEDPIEEKEYILSNGTYNEFITDTLNSKIGYLRPGSSINIAYKGAVALEQASGYGFHIYDNALSFKIPKGTNVSKLSIDIDSANSAFFLYTENTGRVQYRTITSTSIGRAGDENYVFKFDTSNSLGTQFTYKFISIIFKLSLSE